MGKTTLLIVDDHQLVRDGIKLLLAQANDFQIVAEADNGEMAAALAKIHKPMVVLLDISMPNINGLDAVKLIKTASPETKILMLSMHEEPEYVIKSLKGGANGYLLKSVDRDELFLAIRTVVSGNSYFQGSVAQNVLHSFSPEPKSDKTSPVANPKATPTEAVPTLTEREKEILQCVADGLSTKQIGRKLFISPRTVEAHRGNIIKKLGAQNAAELVKLALQYKLIGL